MGPGRDMGSEPLEFTECGARTQRMRTWPTGELDQSLARVNFLVNVQIKRCLVSWFNSY